MPLLDFARDIFSGRGAGMGIDPMINAIGWFAFVNAVLTFIAAMAFTDDYSKKNGIDHEQKFRRKSFIWIMHIGFLAVAVLAWR